MRSHVMVPLLIAAWLLPVQARASEIDLAYANYAPQSCRKGQVSFPKIVMRDGLVPTYLFTREGQRFDDLADIKIELAKSGIRASTQAFEMRTNLKAEPIGLKVSNRQQVAKSIKRVCKILEPHAFDIFGVFLRAPQIQEATEKAEAEERRRMAAKFGPMQAPTVKDLDTFLKATWGKYKDYFSGDGELKFFRVRDVKCLFQMDEDAEYYSCEIGVLGMVGLNPDYRTRSMEFFWTGNVGEIDRKLEIYYGRAIYIDESPRRYGWRELNIHLPDIRKASKLKN